uniref:DUF218 domain-containing protein n=1 Tax=Odontella aurita TaxID=265563 RepID=A0A7S4NEE4_9STRA|eukprot:CAMPEP_0113553746 /NCGR_PEP_ID=MMETSP0015_2-20120614/15777_1 /TAXON_ID=2838 /ORGANISM="Odontella" /LENGTH=225 /DNA_ID=CAMNT_0000454835 /DNA_START=14 /DNA_END=691 /DNA_ORIENTATION=+ /assembly_acc=CAM_ASM_000160
MALPLSDPAIVIVVLGAPTTPEGKPGPDLKKRLDRCLEILKIDPLKASKSLVAVTGGSPQTYGSSGVCPEGVCMQQYLIQRGGVPQDQIIVEDRAYHTFHNALYVKTILRERGLVVNSESSDSSSPPAMINLIVLTTDWHVERSLLCFAAVFSDVPNVTLAEPEVVPSDPTDPEVITRKSKEKMLIDRWIPLCFNEEKDHPDCPNVESATAAMNAIKKILVVDRN